eukprot:4633518-Pyramimonas_sp.AAC.1
MVQQQLEHRQSSRGLPWTRSTAERLSTMPRALVVPRVARLLLPMPDAWLGSATEQHSQI